MRTFEILKYICANEPSLIYSTSPTGSENHLSPLRFQTFNRKVFWNRNEAKWFLDPVGEVL